MRNMQTNANYCADYEVRMSSRVKYKFVVGITALVTGGAVWFAESNGAETRSVQEIIAARQSNLKDLGGAFKTVRDQLRLSKPNLMEIKLAAQQMNDLIADQSHWFPKGSGPESKFKTDAKPEIWSDSQGFAAAQATLAREVPKLSQLANAEDIAGLKAQVPVVGQACKGCHDKYRVPKD